MAVARVKRSEKAAPAATKVATPDRILDASLKLFNEQGFHNVASLRIAMYLGISPGLLSYHFKSKNDIVQALFPRLDEALRQVMEMEITHAAPEAIDRTHYVLRTLWHYRFFFIELLQISPQDKQLLASYEKLENHVLDMMQHSFDARIDEGTMQAPPLPNTTRHIARAIWVIWLDWLRREQLHHPEQEVPVAASVYDAMLRAYCIVQPFFSHPFLDDIVAGLKTRLGARRTTKGR